MIYNEIKEELAIFGENRAALNGFMTTYSGIKFYPLNPTPETVNIYDISKALSRSNRWNGHSSKPYSIAQHSCRVTNILENESVEVQFKGLLHDAAEAYLGDMIRPLKYLQELRAYTIIEESVNKVIASAFSLDTLEKCPLVERADTMALLEEAYHLRPPAEWVNVGFEKLNIDPRNTTFTVWEYDVAEEMFLRKFQDLYKDI